MALAEATLEKTNFWLISGYGPQVWGGGLEEAVNVVAREFAKKDTRVSCLHGVVYGRPQRDEVLEDNLSLHEIPQSRFANFRGFSFERYSIFRRLIEAGRPDFVVVNIPGRIGLAAALALQGSDIPTTFWWHGTHIASDEEYDYQYPSRQIRRFFRKFISNPLKAAALRRLTDASNFSHAACSEFTAKVLQDKGILNHGLAKVLNPPTSVGLDTSSLGDEVYLDGVRADDLVIFIPARVAPDKQFYNVRELMFDLQKVWIGLPRINFVSAGPSPSSEYLAYAFPKIDTEAVKTTYLGVLDRKGMERVYSRADCVFMPNRAESFGLATVEAMRFSLPVLGFRSGGTQEILREFPDYPQYLIDEPRGRINTDPVRSFLGNVHCQRTIALNQRRQVLKRFDPKILADQIFNFVTQSGSPPLFWH